MRRAKSTTKICKHCKAVISFDAKICPQCFKKQGGKLKSIVIGFLVLGVIGAALGGGDDTARNERDNAVIAKDEAIAELDGLQSHNEELQIELELITKELDTKTEELNTKKKELDTAVEERDNLKNELESLNAEYSGYKQQQLAKEEEMQTVEQAANEAEVQAVESVEPVTAEASSEAPTSTTDDTQNEQMVYIPRTGSKYHSSSSCSRMKNPSYVSISSAIGQGYDKCSKCF